MLILFNIEEFKLLGKLDYISLYYKYVYMFIHICFYRLK